MNTPILGVQIARSYRNHKKWELHAVLMSRQGEKILIEHSETRQGFPADFVDRVEFLQKKHQVAEVWASDERTREMLWMLGQYGPYEGIPVLNCAHERTQGGEHVLACIRRLQNG